MSGTAVSGAEPESLLRADLDKVAPGQWHDPAPPVPAFSRRSLAVALVGAGGEILARSPAFLELAPGFRPDEQRLQRIRRSAAPAAGVELLEHGESVVMLYAAAGDASAWPIPDQIRVAAASTPGAVLILAADVRGASGPLRAACEAFRLTGLQTRAVLETIRQGGVRQGAQKLGLSPHTMREALSGAMGRTGTQRLPALVLKLTSLAFGALPDADATEILTDVWGITRRQAGVAGLVASGVSRRDAARLLGMSEALVKKELDQAYQVLEVDSAASLARKVGEAAALHWLTRTTHGEIGFFEHGGEPLRFISRAEGGQIAISDYGPASGRPVLVAHSGLTSRPVSRGLVRALHGAGFRPIAIDRPGFGLSDPAPAGKGGGAYDAAVDDALRVLDQLGIERCDLVARGAGRFVVALHDRAPERLQQVVLVNPGLHSSADGHRSGLFGALKGAYAANPSVIGHWVTQLSRRITFERHRELVRRWMRGSPPDEAAMDDPEIARDYFLSQRMFATGRIAGYVAEQRDYMRAANLQPRTGTGRWRVLVGAHDTMYAPQEVLGYWRQVLPDARFDLVADAGRLLALSHPQYVVDALASAA